MKITICKKLDAREVSQIVDIHSRILDESVLNQFGSEFLTIVYRRLIKNKENIVITINTKGSVIGFLVATVNSINFYTDITSKDFWKLSLEIIKKTITNPKLFIETLLWSFLKSKKSSEPATLMFIAINNEYQGKGYGSQMVKVLDKEFIKRDIFRYKVGTKAKNRKSNNFYKKLNFILIYKDAILGEENNYYLSPIISLTHPGSKAAKKR